MPREVNPRHIKTTQDILHRSSRPQNTSSYIPRKRDWRYATGVFRHEDNERERDKTTWDEMDEDYVRRAFRGRRGRAKRPNLDFSEDDPETEDVGGTELVDVQRGGTYADIPVPSSSQAHTTIHYTRKRPTSDNLGTTTEPTWKEVGLIVRLKLPPRNHGNTPQLLFPRSKPATSESGGATPLTVSTESTNIDSIFSPTKSQTAAMYAPPTPGTPVSPRSNSTGSGNAVSVELPESAWKDETYDFPVRRFWDALRKENGRDRDTKPGRQVPEIPKSYTWFPEAVAVDAAFPPGIPMTAKEILVSVEIRFAFALRFSENGGMNEGRVKCQ
jgi:hypothetical protein